LLVPAAFVAGLFGLADPAGALDQDTLRSPVRLSVVFGTVVDHETEVPIENATVSLGAQPDGARGTGTRVTDEAGRFRFEEVMPGTYTLTVAGFGYRTMEIRCASGRTPTSMSRSICRPRRSCSHR
jgi:protocatechuate 3,4-dioxygenase beta subunit